MSPSPKDESLRVVRLGKADYLAAVELFSVMSAVFEETADPLDAEYVQALLAPQTFWAIAAYVGSEIVGGITAHTLPMTRSATAEIFIYDLAVREEYQRRGIGRRLVTELREQASAIGIDDVFVPADDEDTHALEFYEALGGDAAPVTIFTFGRPPADPSRKE